MAHPDKQRPDAPASNAPAEARREQAAASGIDELADAFAPLMPESAEITVCADDLVADANGEIVLFNDSHLAVVVFETTARVIDEGIVRRHATAGGDDVSGFRFVGFDNGTKVYHPADLKLVVRAGCS